MRVVSLIILLLIIGGAVFVFVHEPTRRMVLGGAKEGLAQAQGYSLATSPKEAMDQFEKAIKSRQYANAARYCSGDYAALLIQADGPARTFGEHLDKCSRIIEEKGMKDKKAHELLLKLDPFPDTFRVKMAKVKEKKPDEAVGFFEYIDRPMPTSGRNMTAEDWGRIDPYMLQEGVLVPKLLMAELVIKKEKDKDVWKIEFHLRDKQKDAVQHFIDYHKRYLPGLASFHDDMVQGRKLADQVGPDLLAVITASK